jgi:hypothetical protein
LPRISTRSPVKTRRNLRLEIRDVGPHREDRMLNIEDNILIREEIMLTTTLFLEPEVEEEEKVE